jgi:hypothetical protein
MESTVTSTAMEEFDSFGVGMNIMVQSDLLINRHKILGIDER